MSTEIEWTDETWNPVVGCSVASPGCDHCYAAGVAHRAMQPAHRGLTVLTDEGPAFNGTVRCLPERLDQPMRWRKPRRVFVNSMSDLFHPDVPYRFARDVYNVMRCCNGMTTAGGQRMPSHTFQVLTKRPSRMADMTRDRRLGYDAERPPSNVWMGTSIESDRYAWRADHLRRAAVAVRFLSLEPLLGPLPSLDLTGIDWVIVGGESGPKARPMHPDWVRDIRDRCVDAGIPFFFKQWGQWAPAGDSYSYWPTQTGQLVYHHHPRPSVFEVVDTLDRADSVLAVHDEHNATRMERVGKKAAGRLLDGRTWDEMPW